MNNTYLTYYNILSGGKIIKMAGPDIRAVNQSHAENKVFGRKQRIPLYVEGRLLERIKK